MKTTGHRRRWILWSALVAVLMGSVAPAATHLVRRTSVVGGAEICSINVSTSAQAAPSTRSEPDTAPGHAPAHCPYCSVHATALGLPPPPATVLPLGRYAHEVPRHDLAAPRTLLAWSVAQARAPPLPL